MANNTGKKTGGRGPNTPNRITQDVRDILYAAAIGDIENIKGLLNELEPKAKIDAIIRLLPYIIPKIETINIEGVSDPRISFSLTKSTMAPLSDQKEIVSN